VQSSSAAEKAEHSRLHTELQRLSAAQAQLHAQLERGKGELAVVNQQVRVGSMVRVRVRVRFGVLGVNRC